MRLSSVLETEKYSASIDSLVSKRYALCSRLLSFLSLLLLLPLPLSLLYVPSIERRLSSVSSKATGVGTTSSVLYFSTSMSKSTSIRRSGASESF